jgi:hypothetical protein
MLKLFFSFVRHNDIPCVKHNIFEKAYHQNSEKPDLYDVLKIGKFSALDFYDILTQFFAMDCPVAAVENSDTLTTPNFRLCK